MSVIIRLQNLPWSANALDIRKFFEGLSIPEGGVHIVGGELGDAFIAFSTDEDARQAFSRNNSKIKEVQISLMLSSRTEMQRVIEAARNQSYAAFMQSTPAPIPIPAAVPCVIPASVPEVKRDSKDSKGDKRDSKRRSRSKSRERDRKDKDKKDKRHRERSRSRSRDRKDRRRRDRSRDRSRSRDRDRRGRDYKKRSAEKVSNIQRDIKRPEVWAQNQLTNPLDAITVAPQPPSILSAFPVTLDEANLTLSSLTALQGLANASGNFGGLGRESWPSSHTNNQNFRQRGPMDNYLNNLSLKDNFHGHGRYHQRNASDNHWNRFEREESDSCVSLEPFYGGYGDIRRFFQGLFISNKGIKFINDANGRRTGLVYVQFGNKKSKLQALNLNGEFLNDKPVKVLHVEDDEFEEAIDRFQPVEEKTNNGRSKSAAKYFNNEPAEPEIKNFVCLTVEDLPTYTKEQDILHLFSQRPLLALILTTKPRGGHIAYVKFTNHKDAKESYEAKIHHVINGKPVTVKPCEEEEFEEINKQHEIEMDLLKSPKNPEIGTCLCVSRLPQKTTEKDIADFFTDVGVIPTKIHMVNNNQGFTGKALCEFSSNDDSVRATKKNNDVLGNKNISVMPLTKEEMLESLVKISPTNSPGKETKDSQPERIVTSFPNDSQNSSSLLQKIQFSTNFSNIGPIGIRTPFFMRNFDSPPRCPLRFAPRCMGGPRHRFSALPEVYDESPPPGCVLYMKNVPYKAGTNDILEFFNGYNITSNVSRRYNPNNTPSDEAKVVFFDPEEAARALQELNKQKIWDRQIFLRQE